MARILVMGDLVPIGSAKSPFCGGDSTWFSEGLQSEWSEADFRVVNLECPLISNDSPAEKIGPCLGVVADNADALSGFSLIGLANNHILDHGRPGLINTIRMLDEANIPHVGAGENINQAGRPYVAEIDGVTVGFIAWSHHEFCIADEQSCGAFPIDVIEGLPIIEELRERCDFVVLLYHGGAEHFPYPLPEQRRICHFLASRGVDVIICQHSHIVGAQETSGDSIIVYGQGNFCFDYKAKHIFPHWTEGILCQLELNKGSAAAIHNIPLVHSRDNGKGPAVAAGGVAERILADLQDRSDILADETKYEAVWNEWASLRAAEFLDRQIPVGRIGRKLLRMTGVSKLMNAQQRLLWNLNRIECEAHSNSIVAGLKNLTSTRHDK